MIHPLIEGWLIVKGNLQAGVSTTDDLDIIELRQEPRATSGSLLAVQHQAALLYTNNPAPSAMIKIPPDVICMGGIVLYSDFAAMLVICKVAVNRTTGSKFDVITLMAP